ncbi:FG-GAP-like repeat-containing protein [Chitinophagaceae bacterium MMS25-I14]
MRKIFTTALLLPVFAALHAQNSNVQHKSGTTAKSQTGNTGSKVTLHTGNTICVLDIDGDGDYDYLDGNISFNDLQLLINGKADYNRPLDTVISQDTTWQSGGHSFYMPQWPAAFYLDYDQDGKKDILVAPNAENSSENYKCLAWYRNTGTTTAPVFTWQGDSLLTNQMIDAGTGSTPLLYDYNKDGKPDLFIGSEGYFQSNGTLVSSISYYLNTSTAGNPSFTLQTTNFLNMQAQGFRGARLAVGDLDKDGKDDLVVGHADGTVSFYHNSAASQSVQPVWGLTQLKMWTTPNNDTINVQSYAAPFIYDIDKDSYPDMIVGCFNGRIFYYRNTGGTTGTVQLTLASSSMGNIKADPATSLAGNSVPFIGKMDASQNDYLLLGSTSGILYRYDGFQNGSGTFNLIDSGYAQIHIPAGFTAPAIADIDGDGRYEMILGNRLGGLLLYKAAASSSAVPYYTEDSSIHVYASNREKVLAWCGGINNPQPALADLDHDGKNDLIIFESSYPPQVKTFKNFGAAGNPDYRYAPSYVSNFPAVSGFLKMVDYNRDDIPDLETNGGGIFSLYRGRYNAQNQLQFDFYKKLFYFWQGSGWINAYVSPADVPDIVDIDNDGDLDFLAYSNYGTIISYYKNLQVEDSLPTDSVRVCLQDNCWGKSYQTFNRTQIVNYVCDPTGTTCPASHVAVNNIQLQHFSCNVYPNPASEMLNIDWNGLLSGSEPVTVSLYTATGQKILSASSEAGQGRIALSLKPVASSGMYICIVESSGSKIIRRISIIK